MESRTVKIGNSFFAGAFRDYSNWLFAWTREILQNSIDAPGSDLIEVTIETIDGNTKVRVSNNGQPMSKEILCDKLLALGESGKTGQVGAVGGFGKAKEI